MNTFQSKVTEAQIGAFHTSLFTAEEWYDLAAQIGLAVKEVPK